LPPVWPRDSQNIGFLYLYRPWGVPQWDYQGYPKYPDKMVKITLKNKGLQKSENKTGPLKNPNKGINLGRNQLRIKGPKGKFRPVKIMP